MRKKRNKKRKDDDDELREDTQRKKMIEVRKLTFATKNFLVHKKERNDDEAKYCCACLFSRKNKAKHQF